MTLAGNWLRFSCSIPPLFVLSHSLSMVNTMGKLALFCAFLSPSSLPLQFHWLLATGHRPLATVLVLLATILVPFAIRHYLPRPSPVGYCLTPTADCRIDNDRTGPDLDARPSIFSMSPNRAIFAEKPIDSSGRSLSPNR